MQEKTLKIEKIFNGRLLKVNKLKVKLPNGNKASREIISHPGAVAIIPILSNKKIIFVKQFRKAIEKQLLEIPAGTLEPKEKPFLCAQRELIEETGFKAKKISRILEFYPAPGYTSEKIAIFKATNLIKVGSKNEPDEFIKICIMGKKDIKKLYKKGKIKDSKTLIGLYALGFI